MRTIKLTDKQYELMRMAIGVAGTYFEEQLDMLEDFIPAWRNSMVKELENMHHGMIELRDAFEAGELEKNSKGVKI